MRRLRIAILTGAMCCALVGCGRRAQPLAYGYYRIDLPEASYHTHGQGLPYSFDLSDYAQVTPINDEPYWINIDYPAWNATIHCSYKSLKTSDLNELTEDTRTLVYKHTIRADAIAEEFFENRAHQAYGVFYEIDGNAASSVQFFVTDSMRHFVRGSLYFNNLPNADSIAPVNAFISNDIRHLMETITWKSEELVVSSE